MVSSRGLILKLHQSIPAAAHRTDRGASAVLLRSRLPRIEYLDPARIEVALVAGRNRESERSRDSRNHPDKALQPPANPFPSHNDFAVDIRGRGIERKDPVCKAVR